MAAILINDSMKLDSKGMQKWRISGLRLRLWQTEREEWHLRCLAAQALGQEEAALADMDIYKKSLDARENGEPFFVYSVDVLCGAAPKCRANGRGLSIIRLREEEALASLPLPTTRLDSPPVVVGAGPAGLFAALYLAEAGFSPILIEQGQPVEQRARDVEKFWRYGLLDCH
ncbi:MAG: FAD-binding protein, partial [Clostridiales bacterium]|nr:FAD-binding protein [Clostridiales bacterium]